MALRVLLADESSTIKKVIQLALQDFAVEVKSVHSGVDVLEVAKSFKPDLIFTDVLLQKRNGYEACAELKADFETKDIPVVLMWSSFMELDEAAFERCHANGRLEKPFDAETLRSLVADHVAKVRKQTLSEHLEFPAAAFPREEAGPPRAQVSAKAQPAPRAPEGPRSFDLDDEKSAFQFSELPKTAPSSAPAPTAAPEPERPTRNWEDITMPKVDDSENWSHQSLSQFNVQLEPLKLESDNVSIEFDVQHGELEGEKRLLPSEPEPVHAPIESTVSRTGYLAPQDATQSKSLLEELDLPQTQAGGEGLSVLSSFETDAPDEMEIPRANPAFNPPPGPIEERRAQPGISQLSADELERIVRAQSREIIEALVRKIVPDLASTMIRDELNRLIGPG